MVKRKEFIDKLALKGYTKSDAATITDDFLQTIVEILVAGGSVRFHGFGSFAIANRKAKTGTNPQTGERMEISGYKCPTFSPGKLLRRAVKEGHIRTE